MTTWHSDLHDRHARHAEYFTGMATSAFGEVAVVSCYAGKLKVVSFDNGRVSQEFDVVFVFLLRFFQIEANDTAPL